jgi:hypothetical protein
MPPAGFTERFAKVNGMPMLVLAGEEAGGTFLIEQAKLVASDVRGQVVAGAGHTRSLRASRDAPLTCRTINRIARPGPISPDLVA